MQIYSTIAMFLWGKLLLCTVIIAAFYEGGF